MQKLVDMYYSNYHYNGLKYRKLIWLWEQNMRRVVYRLITQFS